MEPKVHFRIKKSPLLLQFLSYMTPVHNLTHYSSKIYFNIIFPSTKYLPSCLFPSSLQTKMLYGFFITFIRAA